MADTAGGETKKRSFAGDGGGGGRGGFRFKGKSGRWIDKGFSKRQRTDGGGGDWGGERREYSERHSGSYSATVRAGFSLSVHRRADPLILKPSPIPPPPFSLQ